jgi:hypothetical protein
MMVTRTDGRSVLRLYGAPAERKYRESLGCRAPALTDGELERLAVLHPLAQLELTGDLRLRHVHGRAADGGLLCAGAMPENAAVFVVQQTAAAVLASTRAAARAARAALPRAPRLALVFDCAARRRILGDASASTVDVAALTSEFAESPVAGLFTRGEIARQRGPFGDLNHEIVVVAFA